MLGEFQIAVNYGGIFNFSVSKRSHIYFGGLATCAVS